MPKFDHFDYFHRVWLIFFCVFFCLVGISPNKKPILNNPSRSTLSKIWLTNPLTTRIYWVTLEICLLTRGLKKPEVVGGKKATTRKIIPRGSSSQKETVVVEVLIGFWDQQAVRIICLCMGSKTSLPQEDPKG